MPNPAADRAQILAAAGLRRYAGIVRGHAAALMTRLDGVRWRSTSADQLRAEARQMAVRLRLAADRLDDAAAATDRHADA